MKRTILIFAFMFFMAAGASAQILKPVTWSYAAKKISNTEAVVYLKARMDKGWHIYSQHLKSGGPTKTTFTFAPSKDYSFVGKPTEPKAVVYYDKNFDMNVGYFMGQVIFQQKIKLNKAVSSVKGKVEFMACDDTQCLAADEVNFNIPVK